MGNSKKGKKKKGKGSNKNSKGRSKSRRGDPADGKPPTGTEDFYQQQQQQQQYAYSQFPPQQQQAGYDYDYSAYGQAPYPYQPQPQVPPTYAPAPPPPPSQEFPSPPFEDEREDASFELETLQESKRLWLEYSRQNIGTFGHAAYEYNVFESKKNRFLVVSPASTRESDSNNRRPFELIVHTAREKELFSVTWHKGSCVDPGVSIELFAEERPLGVVLQVKNNMIAITPDGTENLRVEGVPNPCVCNQRGPDSFRSEIFLADRTVGPSDSMGVIGRNGAIMETVVVGEPSAFYFLAAKTSKTELTLLQKEFILAILITFMTQYAGA